MKIDGSTVTGSLVADVCVVGSGAAGVTLAWHLQKAGVSVILAEAGRSDQLYYADKNIFYYGETVGRFATVSAYTYNGKGNNPNSFLTRPSYGSQGSPTERERTYGGTTAHFGAQSRPLEQVDFQGRTGFPAWPLSFAEMQPWYDAAADFCLLHRSFDADYWAQQVNGAVPKLENFDTDMYQFMGLNADTSQGNKNFALRKFDGKTIADTDARVVQNANLVKIDWSGRAVNMLHFASLTGGGGGQSPSVCNQFTVSAKIYVLATGAVENARQLLLAQIPNANIGKYFMCHPLVAGYINPGGDPIRINYSGTDPSWLSGAQKGLMDGNVVDNGVETDTQWTDEHGVTIEGRFIPDAAAVSTGIGRCWFWGGGGPSYFEQAPNANSQVTLSTTLKDSVFGQPLAKIDWQFNDTDRATYETTVNLFKQAVPKFNPQASVAASPWSEIVKRAVVNGHHLGTTRMSETAVDGVVDRNLKSHDVDNLYVAGSSVWRTAGISNPTFSIVAFSIRLASELAQLTQQEQAAKQAC